MSTKQLYADYVTVHEVVKCDVCESTVDIFLVTNDREQAVIANDGILHEYYLCHGCLDELPVFPKPEREYNKEQKEGDLC